MVRGWQIGRLAGGALIIVCRLLIDWLFGCCVLFAVICWWLIDSCVCLGCWLIDWLADFCLWAVGCCFVLLGWSCVVGCGLFDWLDVRLLVD